VQGLVELAVSAAVKAVSVGIAGAGRDWGDAGLAGELSVGAEPPGACGLADVQCGADRPAADLRNDLGHPTPLMPRHCRAATSLAGNPLMG
jgi:hypothetical protein